MKKLLALMLVLLMAAVTGCVFGGDDDGDDNANDNNNGGTTAGNYSATEYWPMQVGSQWDYQSTSTYIGGSYSDDYSVIATGTEQFDNKSYFVLYQDGSYSSTMYFGIRDNVIWQYEPMIMAKNIFKRAPLPETAKTAAIKRINADAQHTPWLDFTQSTWDISSYSEQETDYSYSFTSSGSFQGTENVQTPAGNYSNCLKFLVEYHYQSTSTYNGETYNWTEDTKQYIYLAKNVGPVKFAEYITSEDGSVDDTIIDVLSDYKATGGTVEPQTYTLTGQILDDSGQPVSGISISLPPLSTTATTDADGIYTFSGLSEGTYVVTPTSTDYTFSPSTDIILISGYDASAQTIIATAASSGDPGTGEDPGTGSDLANQYFPTAIGSMWQYNVQQSMDEYLFDPFAMVTEVVGTENVDGYTFYQFQDTEYSDQEDPTSISSLYRIYNNVVWQNMSVLTATRNVEIPAKVISAMKRSAINEVPWLNFNKPAGETWVILSTSTSYEGDVYNEYASGNYLGTDVVQVPAGTFQDCRRFQIDMQYYWTFADGTSGSYETTLVFWLAPNVGLIRIQQHEVNAWDDETGHTTFDFDIVTELTSYSLGN